MDATGGLIDGWLHKQGGRVKSWKRRFCTVRGNQMLYFREPKDVKPLGVITLHRGGQDALACEIRIVPEDEFPRKPYCFEIKTTGGLQRTYYCHTTSMKDLERWLNVLHQVVYASRGGGMFGTTVADQLSREQRMFGEVPVLVSDCVAFLRNNALDEVGIFRLPGSSARIRELKYGYATGARPSLDEADAHSVASLLKLYLRELPEPLMTSKLHRNFLNAVQFYKLSDFKDPSSIQRLIPELPAHNACLLRYLCQFLAEVVTHAEVNKMTLANVATVFAPNFLNSNSSSSQVLMEETPLVHRLTMVLIERHEDMFKQMPSADGSPVQAPVSTADSDLDDYDEDEDETYGFLDPPASAVPARRATTADGSSSPRLSGLLNRRRQTGEFDRLQPATAPEGGLQGPVRALQEQLRAEQARSAYLQRLLHQSRDAVQQERSLRVEAERNMQAMLLQLRSMGVVLPNMAEPEAIGDTSVAVQKRHSAMLDDADELIDLMALGKMNMQGDASQ
eukprot:TRINITY_DN6592_c0_g1_i4.p1 TRINITY_DN6592_c0_g1~~TRINITY_DN6592_c0_g1_i4.p1  ORF type:complete len:507 (+),score=111.37 TRINITY_DN6592_c0_g1_i4:143-1663(+)